MGHTPIKPPTKRVAEIEKELTDEMYDFLKIRKTHKAKDNLIVNFLIKKLAKIKAVNEILQNQMNEFLKKE